ncbi:MAG: sigma-54 dependent transcriptional regulator [Bacteroidota bacterium]
MKQLSVLILDDETRIRSEIMEFLGNLEYKCFGAERPSTAQEILDQNEIDLMIADINLPEKDGLTYLREIKKKNPKIEVIVITGYANTDKAVQALRLGAIDFLSKPFTLSDLGNAILRTKRFLEMSSYVKHANETIDLINSELKKDTAINFIGTSAAAKKIVSDIDQVAKSNDTSVLITGESGTGKELVARSIHLLSGRSQNPFFAVNSSAIPDSLFESELFGFKKGAFTGAYESKAGWFEQANNGTIFLDEISEMNSAMQVKILRVIEDRKVRRIGSDTELDLNVRVISASNQNFEEIIRQGKFRTDLYYRLAVFVVHLPPLRERKDDIPLLVEHYVKYFSEKMKKNILQIEQQVFDKLTNYSFPGNIRELRNITERAVILCKDKTITATFFECGDSKRRNISPGTEINFDLERNERDLIIKALEKTNYNKAQAAKLLNITWQSLDRRLAKFNLDPGDKNKK